MRVIYKYIIPMDSTKFFSIDMPQGADIITVQNQNGLGPCIWAIVDTDVDVVERKFCVLGTGWDLSDLALECSRYIGTWQDGWLVWHLFGER